jgi:hypothetical protein
VHVLLCFRVDCVAPALGWIAVNRLLIIQSNRHERLELTVVSRFVGESRATTSTVQTSCADPHCGEAAQVTGSGTVSSTDLRGRVLHQLYRGPSRLAGRNCDQVAREMRAAAGGAQAEGRALLKVSPTS